MASEIKRATAAFVIAGMFCIPAITAAAGNEDGPKWPNIYEPQWPNLSGEPDAKPEFPRPLPQAKPEVTGSVSPVARRWHDFGAAREIPSIDGEFGLRYWYSFVKTAKNLYDIPGTSMVSRLTYEGLRSHAAEGFGRVDHTSGFFIKGILGAGITTSGKLIDEDFPPFIAPYSSTTSRQHDGNFAHAAIDLGFNLIRQPGLRLGVFAGYHYLDQEVNAYGCSQNANNAAICGNPLDPKLLVISQNNQWHSLRVGVDASIKLTDALQLRLDAAYLPYVKLSGSDSHWLRIGNFPGDFTGPVPEDGQGRGYQLEAALSYAVNPWVNFAAGARYWRMETQGHTHFENHVVGFTAFPQKVEWSFESLGFFLQASFKFGPYPTGGLF